MAEKQYIRSLSTKILIAFGTMSVGLTLFSLFATLITTDGERSKYATLLMGIFQNLVVFGLAFFSLEAFNFYNWVQWLSSIGGSALLTIILILVIENFRSKR